MASEAMRKGTPRTGNDASQHIENAANPTTGMMSQAFIHGRLLVAAILSKYPSSVPLPSSGMYWNSNLDTFCMPPIISFLWPVIIFCTNRFMSCTHTVSKS